MNRYILWENLLYVLNEYRGQSQVYIGRHMHGPVKQIFASGGAGYVITKQAARKIIDEGSRFPHHCPKDGRHEDVNVARYLYKYCLSKTKMQLYFVDEKLNPYVTAGGIFTPQVDLFSDASQELSSC